MGPRRPCRCHGSGSVQIKARGAPSHIMSLVPCRRGPCLAPRGRHAGAGQAPSRPRLSSSSSEVVAGRERLQCRKERAQALSTRLPSVAAHGRRPKRRVHALPCAVRASRLALGYNIRTQKTYGKFSGAHCCQCWVREIHRLLSVLSRCVYLGNAALCIMQTD